MNLYTIPTHDRQKYGLWCSQRLTWGRPRFIGPTNAFPHKRIMLMNPLSIKVHPHEPARRAQVTSLFPSSGRVQVASNCVADPAKAGKAAEMPPASRVAAWNSAC